jgi:hypothetical protein
MLPLAVSGPDFMAVVIVLAIASIWWLLRAELRDSAGEPSEEEAPGQQDAPDTRLS